MPSTFELTDRNGNGEIDKAEYRTRMLMIFEALDADADGVITFSEVPDNRKEAFPVADTDGKTGVDLHEYLAYTTLLFGDTDTDGNGVLTAGEVRTADEGAQ